SRIPYGFPAARIKGQNSLFNDGCCIWENSGITFSMACLSNMMTICGERKRDNSYMSRSKKVHDVEKEIIDNAKFIKDEARATISFDLDYREIAIHDRRVQLYYVNGMVNDLTVATILKMLIHVNDDESESDKMFDIVRNRSVNEDVKKENQMSKLID